MDQRRGRDRGSVLTEETAHPLLARESNSAVRLCLSLPWFAGRAVCPFTTPLAHRPRRPRAADGQVTGTVHSVVCLCRGWHVSDPLALRVEASSSTQDQGPGLFSAEPPWQGRTDRCHASAHLGRTHAPQLNPRCKHSTCTPRTPVCPFRLLQLGNQAGTRAKTKEPGSVIVSQVTSN